MFHPEKSCLVGHSFRHYVPRRYSSTLRGRNTGPFAPESHSFSNNKTAFAAAMICAASVVAATAADNQNTNTTQMQGRFSFFKQSQKTKTLLQHPNITTWTKGGRTIHLLGARNYSTESATLATQLIETIQPQAVLIDIDEHVFVSYGMYDEVIKALEQDKVSTTDLNFDFQGNVEGMLPAVPKHDGDGNDSSATSFLESLLGSSNNAVETAIQTMFANLKYAGIDETQPMASSGQHFVHAFVEGHKHGATLVLGGRNYEITKARSDEAMSHTPALAATIPLDLKWRPDETDRENYRRIRNEMQRVFPIFFQIVGTELDEHIANKLNKLDIYPNIVAVVMMLHVDGVEESLQKMGWKEQG